VAALLGFAALVTSCQVAQAPAPTALPDEARVASACRVVSVVDGDTVDMACAGGGAFRARLTGYDTPESVRARLRRRGARRAAGHATAERSGGRARSVEPRFGGIDRYGRHLSASRSMGATWARS
jgi:endonuclease YncB( thermonuclease family)